jgi:hypothetical protein
MKINLSPSTAMLKYSEFSGNGNEIPPLEQFGPK